MKSRGMVALACLSVAVACTGEDPRVGDGPNAGGDAGATGDAAAEGFTLGSIAPLSLAPGATASLDVSIVRAGTVGPVHVVAEGLAGGVQAPPIDIAEGTDRGTMSLTVDAGALNARTSFTLRATAGSSVASQSVGLTVRGAIGTLDTTKGGVFPISADAFRSVSGLATDRLGRPWMLTSDCELQRLLPTGEVDVSVAHAPIGVKDPLVARADLALVRCGGLAIGGDALSTGVNLLRLNINTNVNHATVGVLRWDLDGKLSTTKDTLYEADPYPSSSKLEAVALDPDGNTRIAVASTPATQHQVHVVGANGRFQRASSSLTIPDSATTTAQAAFDVDGKAARIVASNGGVLGDGAIDGNMSLTAFTTRANYGWAVAAREELRTVVTDADGRTYAVGGYNTVNMAADAKNFVGAHILGGPWEVAYKSLSPGSATGMSRVFQNGERFERVVVDAQRSVLVLGTYATTSGARALFAMRFTKDGALDTTFGVQGYAAFSTIAATAIAAAVLQDDGLLVGIYDEPKTASSLVRLWL